MTISFRMTATIATLYAFPALISRSWNSRSSGFHRDALTAAMYRMSRSPSLPPSVWRFPPLVIHRFPPCRTTSMPGSAGVIDLMREVLFRAIRVCGGHHRQPARKDDGERWGAGS